MCNPLERTTTKNCVIAETYSPVYSWENKALLTRTGPKHSCMFCMRSFFIGWLLGQKVWIPAFLSDEGMIRDANLKKNIEYS